MVTTLSLILHMSLVSVQYPVELMEFFGILFPFVTLDLVKTDSLYEKMFRFSEIDDDRPLTDQFEIVGYSSIFVVQNIGSLFIYASITSALLVIFWFVQRVTVCGILKRKVGFLGNQVYWSRTIDFCKNNYLVFCTVSFIQIKNLRFGH